MPTVPCPLCANPATSPFHSDNRRDYKRCRICHLIFVPADQHLDEAEEKSIYDLHRNDSNDPGYRRFLSRLASPLLQRLAPNSTGLDFGCGPGPLLAAMLREAGHTVNLFDPYYANEPEHLHPGYDFITCTEVIEHLRQPRRELDNLLAILKPGGHLGLMTKLALDAQAFAKWHYKNDLTHIAFFSDPCLEWYATQNRCRIEFIGADVIILTKPD